MSEPLELNGPADDVVEARLRSISVAPVRFDRDRLMYLAGQRSVTPPRRSNRFWPGMAAVSWAACAAIAAYAMTRPPQIVTQERIVERIIEAPFSPASPLRAESHKDVPAVAEKTPRDEIVTPSNESDFRFLDRLRSPLTALASRPALFVKASQDVVASVEARSDGESRSSKTQLDLRRELLDGNVAPRPDRLWWF